MIERIPRKEELKYGKYFLATEAPKKNKNDKFDINISRRKNIFDDESLDVADNVPLDDMDMDGIADYDELDDVDLADALTLDDVESPDPVDIPDPNDRLKIIDSLSDIRKKPKITNDDLEEYDDNEPTPIEDSEDGPTPIEDDGPAPIDEPDNSPTPIEEPSDIEDSEPAPIDEPDNGPTPIEEPSDVQVDTPTNDTEPAAIDEPDNSPTPIEEPSDTENGPTPIEDNGPTPIEEPSDVQVDTPTNDTEPAAIDEPDGPTPIEEPNNADNNDGPTPINEPDNGPTPIEEPNNADNNGSAPDQQPDTNFNNNNPNNNTNNNQNQQNNQGPGVEYDSTRKYVLFKEYMSLYNALDNYIFKLEDNIKDDIVSNQIIKTSVNKLREIKEIVYDYIIIKFDNNTYIQSLLFYQNLVTSVQMVFKLLTNIEKKDEEV